LLYLDFALSIMHLAGAVGKPVWTLLPIDADGRCLIERRDSPWYPTMQLFRQPRDWRRCLARWRVRLVT
jgi:hypothetical protein